MDIINGLMVQIEQAQPSWITAIIGIMGALIGVLLGGFVTYSIEKYKVKNNELQRRQQIYSQLIGQKSLLIQCYRSFYTSFILATVNDVLGVSIEHLSKAEITEYLDYKYNKYIKSGDFEREKFMDLSIELAKSKRDLWEIIGLLQVLFHLNEELINIIEQIRISEEKFEELAKDILREFEELMPKDSITQTELFQLSSEIIDLKQEKEKEFTVLEDDMKSEIDRILQYIKYNIGTETGQKFEPKLLPYKDDTN